MEIRKFEEADLERVFEIQQDAFRPLYEKYQDEISPYLEDRDRVLFKFRRDHGYVFCEDGIIVGMVRVNTYQGEADTGFITGLAVHPDYQGRGIAQKVLPEVWRRHPEYRFWRLDTILQEAGNCHLYEKLGFRDTGEREVINDKMTLIFYRK